MEKLFDLRGDEHECRPTCGDGGARFAAYMAAGLFHDIERGKLQKYNNDMSPRTPVQTLVRARIVLLELHAAVYFQRANARAYILRCDKAFCALVVRAPL